MSGRIALHAFAADVAAAAEFGARANLVDLVEKNDAVVLRRLDGFRRLSWSSSLSASSARSGACLGDAHAPVLPPAKRLAENVAQIDMENLRVRHAWNLRTEGMPPASFISISISLPSSSPARRALRKDSRVAPLELWPTHRARDPRRALRPGGFDGGRFFSRTWAMAIFTRSRHDLLERRARHSPLR